MKARKNKYFFIWLYFSFAYIFEIYKIINTMINIFNIEKHSSMKKKILLMWELCKHAEMRLYKRKEFVQHSNESYLHWRTLRFERSLVNRTLLFSIVNGPFEKSNTSQFPSFRFRFVSKREQSSENAIPLKNVFVCTYSA